MRRVLLLLLAGLPLAAQKQHELCAVCHTETVQDYLTHPHFQKGLQCAACHGDSVAHRTSQGHTPPDRVAPPHQIPALCGACHLGKGSVPILKQYTESKHGRLVQEQSKIRAPHCGTCHGVHNLRAPRAAENQCKRCHVALPAPCSATPPRRAPVSCAACHNPHTLGHAQVRRAFSLMPHTFPSPTELWGGSPEPRRAPSPGCPSFQQLPKRPARGPAAALGFSPRGALTPLPALSFSTDGSTPLG